MIYMSKTLLKYLNKANLINLIDNEIVYKETLIQIHNIYYNKLSKGLKVRDIFEIKTNVNNLKLSHMQTNVNVLFYQANSLLEEHLFSFIGSFLTFEKARMHLFSLMEVIVEVSKAILNVPLFNVESINDNEYIQYTVINGKNIEFSNFKVSQINDLVILEGQIFLRAFLSLLIVHLNSKKELVLPHKISQLVAIIKPVKPERIGIMDYVHHIDSIFNNASLPVKIINSSEYKNGKFNELKEGIPFVVRISKKEVRDKTVSIIDNYLEEIYHINENNLITEFKTIIKNQTGEMYKRALKKSLKSITTIKDLPIIDENTYLRITWCGDKKCLNELKGKIKPNKIYLPFNQNVSNKECLVCKKKAHKSLLLVK